MCICLMLIYIYIYYWFVEAVKLKSRLTFFYKEFTVWDISIHHLTSPTDDFIFLSATSHLPVDYFCFFRNSKFPFFTYIYGLWVPHPVAHSYNAAINTNTPADLQRGWTHMNPPDVVLPEVLLMTHREWSLLTYKVISYAHA